MKYRLVVIFSLVIFLIAGVAVAVVSQILNSQDLVVNYKNIDKINVYTTTNYDRGKLQQKAAVIKESGHKTRLPKGSYTLVYSASADYSGGIRKVTLGEAVTTINIEPYYSQTKLDFSIDKELPAIKKVLLNKYPLISKLYIIQRGMLYHYGEWYGTTLQYKGDDYTASDTLKLVMHKEKNQWIIKTNPPNIYLPSSVYKNIPSDILDDINNNQHTPMLKKFLQPDISHAAGGQ